MLDWIIGSSILAAIIIGLRYILKGKISLRLQYALWGLLLVRLLVPFNMGSSSLSVMNPLQRLPVVQEAGSISGVDHIAHLPDGSVQGFYPSDYMGDFPTVVAESKTADQYARMEKMLSWRQILLSIWLRGAGVMFIAFAVCNWRFGSRLRRSRRALEVDSSDLPVYVSNETETPCLFGFWSPAIYVTPEVAEDQEILRYAIEHETSHFRHGDNFWSSLRAICLVVHWYNPLIWWAAVLSRRDAELACDEATIRRIGETERANYGRILIGLTCQKRPALLTAATTMTGAAGSIRERIILLARKPQMALYTLIAVLVMVAVAAGCTFTGARIGLGPADKDLTLHQTEALTVAIPNEYLEQLIVHIDDKPGDDSLLISVYERASVEAAADYGSADSGLGWLFSLIRYDRVKYERYLCEDGSGLAFFARDDDWYYGYATPTDVRFYRSGDDFMKDYALYDALRSEVAAFVQDDFISRNKLKAYDDALARDEYTYSGEHKFIKYYPYYSINGSTEQAWILVLSQPAKQGADGIWCVERMTDSYGNVYLWFPDSGLPAAEYYAGLQAQCDAGERPELLEAQGAAAVFVAESGYFHSPVIEGSFEVSDGGPVASGAGNIDKILIDCLNSDGAYAEAAQYQLSDCLLNYPARTLNAVGAREKGIRDWLCWQLAEHVKGRGLDTKDILAAEGLSEDGLQARTTINRYLAENQSAPRSWRQVYLDFWNESLAARAKDGEIVGVGLMDFNFDGVPELLAWQPAASASEFALLHYTDGLTAYHNIGSGYTAVLWDRPLSDFGLTETPPATFWLVRNRDTDALHWCVHSQNGEDGRMWGGYQLLYAADEQLAASYETEEGAKEAWGVFTARYEIVDLDYSAFVLSSLHGDRLDAASVNALLNSWRPLKL